MSSFLLFLEIIIAATNRDDLPESEQKLYDKISNLIATRDVVSAGRDTDRMIQNFNRHNRNLALAVSFPGKERVKLYDLPTFADVRSVKLFEDKVSIFESLEKVRKSKRILLEDLSVRMETAHLKSVRSSDEEEVPEWKKISNRKLKQSRR